MIVPGVASLSLLAIVSVCSCSDHTRASVIKIIEFNFEYFACSCVVRLHIKSSAFAAVYYSNSPLSIVHCLYIISGNKLLHWTVCCFICLGISL